METNGRKYLYLKIMCLLFLVMMYYIQIFTIFNIICTVHATVTIICLYFFIMTRFCDLCSVEIYYLNAIFFFFIFCAWNSTLLVNYT